MILFNKREFKQKPVYVCWTQGIHIITDTKDQLSITFPASAIPVPDLLRTAHLRKDCLRRQGRGQNVIATAETQPAPADPLILGSNWLKLTLW